MKTVFAAIVIVASAFAASAQDRPTIVTVNYPLQVFAQTLVGDDADVVFPVPADADPSFWRPSIAAISTFQSADLIVLNGAGFASWVDRVSLPRSKIVNTTAAIKDRFIATQSITHSHGDGGEHAHDGVASYTWLDPELAIAQAAALADAITTRGLAPADKVAQRMDTLRADLQALDAQGQALMADLRDVPMIATHPRYQYFARRYGLSIASLEWDAGAAPTSEDLDALAQLTQDTGARILIWEARPPAAALEATSQLGLRNVVFEPLAQTSSDHSFVRAYSDALVALSDANNQTTQ